MNHYKSWSGLNKKLSEFLYDPLKDRIDYFITRYHDVNNAYGRAAILLDKNEVVRFSWAEMYKQEYEISKKKFELKDNKCITFAEIKDELKTRWDANCTYYEMDFLSAATDFLQMSIKDSLKSDNYIIRVFAILDKRLGKRTLQTIREEDKYKMLPEWVKQFYELRLNFYNC